MLTPSHQEAHGPARTVNCPQTLTHEIFSPCKHKKQDLLSRSYITTTYPESVLFTGKTHFIIIPYTHFRKYLEVNRKAKYY